MKRVKVGLNGFGRIGRAVARIAFERDVFDIVAINTRSTSPNLLAYLLKYDSVYKTYPKEVTSDKEGITVAGKKIVAMNIADPAEIPWDKYGVEVVLDATGAFTNQEDLKKHLRGSVKKVILTAPAKDEETLHCVLGVNDDKINWKEEAVISNASCTTNNAAPMFMVLDEYFGVESGFLTTIHAYTASQSLLDDSNKKETRSRAAGLNLIPTTTGAAKAVTKVLPHLKGKIDGMAVRAPVPVGSFTDVTALVKKTVTEEEVNKAFSEAALGKLKGILAYETLPLVSSDYIGNPHSVIFDANYTKVIDGRLVKVFGWYDNEWGYSHRLVDLVVKIGEYL